MIRHSVVIKLNHPAGSPIEKMFLDEARKLKSIPVVMKFEVMKQISLGNLYDFGISMEFEDQQKYDFDTNHPDHIRFVQKIWILNMAIFMEIDYLITRNDATILIFFAYWVDRRRKTEVSPLLIPIAIGITKFFLDFVFYWQKSGYTE